MMIVVVQEVAGFFSLNFRFLSLLDDENNNLVIDIKQFGIKKKITVGFLFTQQLLLLL